MLVCNISRRPTRAAISAALAEAIGAADTCSSAAVFARLVDDPASAHETCDAFVGMIISEAASATDAFSTAAASYSVAINEAVGATEAADAVVAYAGVITEAAAALDVPDGSLPATTTYNGTPSAGVAMSNGNLTVTHGTTNNGVGVNSTAFLTTGKHYFEVTVQASTFGGNHLGIYQSGTFAAAATTGKATTVVVGSASNIYTNGANTTKNIGTTAVGDILGFAIDLTNRLAWIRRNNGNWNADATADPATGVGGVTIATGSFAPYVAFTNGAATNAFTGNFGQAAFANTAPSGFGYW